MNKNEIIDVIVTLTECDRKDCEKVFEAAFIVIAKFLERNESINIKNFGTFKISNRKAYTGVKPSTGEKIKIKAHKTISFKVSNNLKEKFN